MSVRDALSRIDDSALIALVRDLVRIPSVVKPGDPTATEADVAGRLVVGAFDAAIICEPEQNKLCLEQRGVLWARVSARGRMAHGAMPEAGANPITAVGALLREAPRLERRLRRLSTRSRHLRPPTVTPTVLKAPVRGLPQPNVIPSSADVTLDVRLTPGPDGPTVARELDAVCRAVEKSCPDVSVAWEPVGDRAAPALRRRSRLDRRDSLEDDARDPDRDLRPGKPADPASDRRVRGDVRSD